MYNSERDTVDMVGDTTEPGAITVRPTTMADVTHTGMTPVIMITIPDNSIDTEIISTINRDTTIFTGQDIGIVVIATAIKIQVPVL